MTGSGKTGLGIVLIEEVLRAGSPPCSIDPKGDLTNLCLTFPTLAPADFRPWVNEGQAEGGRSDARGLRRRAGDARGPTGSPAGATGPSRSPHSGPRPTSPSTRPARTAGVPSTSSARSRSPADRTTPRSSATRSRASSSGLLGLVGIDADPLAEPRAHPAVQPDPPRVVSRAGPSTSPTLVGRCSSHRSASSACSSSTSSSRRRTARRSPCDSTACSPRPSFAAWAAGRRSTSQRCSHAADGKPRCAIVTTAHLSDEERQFVTTLVLSKLVTWMRTQSGTTDLRALLYMDEVAGLPAADRDARPRRSRS